MWWENTRITIHVSVIEALRSVGYELRNTIIWDRTNIVNNIGIFGWPSNYITMGTTFEYLLDFWRPEQSIILPSASSSAHEAPKEKSCELPEVDELHSDKSKSEVATTLNGKTHRKRVKKSEKTESISLSNSEDATGKVE